MPYAQHDDLRIHYRVLGSGPPLVLQHGSMSSQQTWTDHGFAAALAPYFQLVMLDARGHGASDKPHDAAAYALPHRVGDVLAVLDALGITQAHYWGYSMGGWIGYGLAAQAPQRLLSMTLGGAHAYADEAAAFVGVDGSDPDAFITAMEAFIRMPIDPEMRAWILRNDIRAIAAAMHPRAEQLAALPGIKVPSFLYVGGNDPRQQKVQACAQLIPGARCVVLPGLNHMQAGTQSAAVLPAVLDFLHSVPAVAAAQR